MRHAIIRIPTDLALVALLSAVLFLTVAPPTTASSARGDANCSGATDARDALDILVSLAGQDVVIPQECAPIGQQSVFGLGGDVNCDREFDTRDLLTALRIVAGFDVHPCLEVTLSGFGQVSEELGYDGGTLTTFGLDGTKFTLDVPEGALAAAELISLTPVESIDNLPVDGGLVAAVDLQPSGLLFWEPVVLTIDPPADIPASEQAAFVISQGEFVGHPFVLNSVEMQLPLTHFSTAGVGSGDVLGASPLTLAEDAYAAQVAPLVNAERAARLGGGTGDPDFDEDLAAIIGPYIDGLIDSLQPPAGAMVVAAAPNCLAAAQVVPLAFGHGTQAQALGGGGAYLQLVQLALQSISSSLGPCRQIAFERCLDQHDTNAIALIVLYTRAMQTLGIEATPSPLDEMMEKCARFQVFFDSYFCVDSTDEPDCGCPSPNQQCTEGIRTEYFVQDDMYFSMSVAPGAGPLVSAPLVLYRGDWGEYGGCEGTYSSPGSTFQVTGGGVSMNLTRTVNPPDFPEFTLVINPGIPPETLHLVCTFGSDTQYATLWWQKWCSWHQPELTPPYFDTAALCFYNDEPEGWEFAITDWDKNWNYSDNRSAVKEYHRNYRDVGVLEIGWEKSDLTLIHEPVR